MTDDHNLFKFEPTISPKNINFFIYLYNPNLISYLRCSKLGKSSQHEEDWTTLVADGFLFMGQNLQYLDFGADSDR